MISSPQKTGLSSLVRSEPAELPNPLFLRLYNAASSAWVVLPFIAAALIGLFAIRELVTSVVPFFFLMGVVGATLVSVFTGKDRAQYLKLFLATFALQVIIAVLFHYIFLRMNGVPFYGVRYYGQVNVDGFEYNQWGLQASRLPWWDYRALRTITSSRYYGYIYTIGMIHRFSTLFGDASAMNPRLLNAFAGGLLAVLIAFIAHRTFSFPKKTAIATGYLVGAYPVTLFAATLVQRDILISLLILFNVFIFERLRTKGFNFILVVVQGIALAMLLEFRYESLLPLIGAFGLTIFFSPVEKDRGIGNRVLILLSLVLVMSFVILQSGATRPIDLLVERGTQGYQEYILATNVAEERSVSRLLLTLPFPLAPMARLAYNLILPVPLFSLSELDNSFVALSAAIWYPLIPFAVMALISGLRDPRKIGYAMSAAVFFGGVAFTTLSIRHAMQYIPLLLLFGIDGVRRHRSAFKRFLPLGLYLLGWAFIVYLYYKLY